MYANIIAQQAAMLGLDTPKEYDDLLAMIDQFKFKLEIQQVDDKFVEIQSNPELMLLQNHLQDLFTQGEDNKAIEESLDFVDVVSL
jgi:hypothetical protein